MIAVVGATGNTGRAVVKELKALGQDPVCIVRNADKAREVLGPDAKTAVAELTDRPALEKALKGVTSVFVVTGHNPQMVEQQNNVLDAALQAGVEYLVRVSGNRLLIASDSESVDRPRPSRDRGAAAGKRHQMGHPAARPVHAEHFHAGRADQERRQDRAALHRRPAARLHRRARYRRRGRPHPSRSGPAHRQDLRVHRRPQQLRRICRSILAGAGPQDHLRAADRRTERAGA